ncbi:ATPase [Acuticoccus sediminis]|uniref:ATPase n=1 Tax=Acuticoccus sediminis TaxID=2184697 RepID=A0A8B2NVM3_9HYPH|nr:winged helix-turn-helix domain-containing protein [Acuticoccus sediminis]RAI01803.1 ATPase [Acuticoccus sediminis]
MPGTSSDAASETKYAFGRFELDTRRRLLLRDGEPIRVGSRAIDLLTVLIERAGETVSKQDLMDRAWPDVFVHEDNLKVNIAGLRRVLDRGGRTSVIATVPGRGYRFIAAVERAAPAGERGGFDVLPAPPPLVGRAADVATVAERLGPGRLVTVLGAGGIGKTVVAVAAAHRLVDAFADAAAFIDLTKISDGALVPAIFASTLGVATTGEEPLAGVARVLGTRPRLLIVDNCEHVLSAAAVAIEQLMRGLPNLAVLATSREPLRLREERVYRLDTLANAPGGTPTASLALSYPAVELFVTRAAERAGYVFTDADAPVVAELCRRLDGMPLAIELAATQTAARGAVELLTMLEDRFRLLSYGPRQAPPRQQTLLATLDWSYNLLPDDEADLLRALAVFMGPFDVEGALAVAQADADPVAVVDALARLSAKCLLVAEVRNGVPFYHLLETTRAYCLERVERSGEGEALFRRHAEHVCALLERASLDWMERPAREWGAVHDRVLDDLRAALAWCRRRPADRLLGIRLTIAGSLLWTHLSQLAECRVHVARAVADLDAAGLAGSTAEMQLQAALASATMYTRGLVPEAMDASRRALELAGQLGNTEFYLRSLKTLATYENLSGKPASVVSRLEHFAQVAEAEDPFALPDGERLLAIAEYYLGRFESSRRRLEHLMQQARGPGGVRSTRFEIERTGVVGCALATVQWLTGLPDTAMRTAARMVELSLLSGHELSLSNTLALACQVALWAGRYAEAERYRDMLDEPLCPHDIDFWRRPFALYARGVLACVRSGPSVEGIGMIRRAIADLEGANLLLRTPHYLGTLAEALAARGTLDEAADTIALALDRARIQNERWCVPELLRIQGTIELAHDRADDAEATLLSALGLADEIGALSWQLRAANDLAMLWVDRRRGVDVRPMLSPIVGLCTEGFDGRDFVVATGLIGGGTGRASRHAQRQLSPRNARTGCG